MRKSLILFVLALLCAPPLLARGSKPIVGMPDYNGTYYGTPNTGRNCDADARDCDSTSNRMMFTTLYRDNYNRTSGCAGERCGKHPGVDIGVESGTDVVAALGGKIHIAKCSSTWGGLVIVEADNPYVSGEKVYVSYAHLSDYNDHSVGTTVNQGDKIGESGGATSDACHGASTGSHLHFQVDKPHGGTYPWYPPKDAEGNSTVELADSNFEVTGKTHNPLPFVLGYAYNYTFAENGNKELWGARNVNDYNTASSDLWVDSSSSYTYTGRSSWIPEPSSCTWSDGYPCSREITLDADIFKRLVLRLDFKCNNNPVVLWYRGPDNAWRYGTFNYDSARTYTLGLSGLTYWNGIITDLMVQPSQGCTASPGPEEYFFKQAYFLQ